ncbi:MAG TPA: penicillin-binding transpeptidase domain-containing protein [Candidatus Acidoferrum sp.]|nr:penicillin-binding transpeptidase domain-containing protein [Candidatus Acidoferrum sp.]
MGSRSQTRVCACAALLLFVFQAGATYLRNTEAKGKLQEAVERAMEGQAGAAIVADVATGEILAARGLDVAAHRLERPGSAVKPFVLTALLESGKLNATQRLLCRRPLRIGGVRMDCAHPSSVVDLDAEEAIAYSCNSYFAEAATRLSAAELVQAFRRAGLDSPSGMAKNEANGRIAMPRDRDSLQLEALGERGIEVTPLEVLAAYRKLALQKRNGSAAEVDAAVFAGLEQSVAYGIAHAANVEGMKIAGKTGTAASRESSATHGFFVGYAPAEKPEIVVMVFLERGHGGDAAGVAQTVFAEFAKSGRTP